MKPLIACAIMMAAAGYQGPERPESRPRARDIGINIGVLPPGPLNAITDVSGVRVGHCTVLEGDSIRTGVTAVLPHSGNIFQSKVPGAIVVGNGFGKLVGVTQVQELGLIETPILLTNTLATYAAADALVEYMLAQPGNEDVRSVNPLVGETNDGYVNDIRARRVSKEHVLKAIAEARDGPVGEGSVGAGMGTRTFGWKGGIGTASRRLPEQFGGYTLGVLVQSNFDGVLTIAGAPVGKELGQYYLRGAAGEGSPEQTEPGGSQLSPVENADADGSCMIVLATDAPLDVRQLERLGKRALLGLAAVGSPITHGSGDYVIAFSTSEKVRTPHTVQPPAMEQTRAVLRDEALSPLFQAAREATEEAIVNSLLGATAITGFRGRTVEAIPIERVIEICKRHGVIGK